MVYHKNMGKELSIIIFDKSKVSSELTEIYLKELEDVKEIKVYSDYVKGFEECNLNAPSIAIVDISDTNEFAYDILEKLSRASIPTIVTSVNTSSTVLIKALRCGAREFLPKPILKHDLQTSIKKVFEPILAEETESKVITIFSGKGGCGKTTIASNLALELAKQTNKKTALIDLNFCLGETASFLDTKSSFNLSKLLGNVDRMTPEFLSETLEKHKDTNLYILSESPTGDTLSSATFNKIAKLLNLLKECFSYIVIDTPCTADEKIFKTLQLADFVLYISAVNMNSIKNTKQCLTMLKDKGVTGEKIKIILNRYIENDELTTEEIEKELGCNIYKKIPNNYYTVMSAINKGIAVSEENINSNVAESFRELAVMLSDSIMNNSLRTLRGDYEH